MSATVAPQLGIMWRDYLNCNQQVAPARPGRRPEYFEKNPIFLLTFGWYYHMY